jgi:hypothetical protein
MLQTHKINKEVFFTYDGVQGIIIKQLDNNTYLIAQGGLYTVFTLKSLENSLRNDQFVTLPFVIGAKEFGSPYAVKLATFDCFLLAFKKEFGIPIPVTKRERYSNFLRALKVGFGIPVSEKK